MMAQEHTPVLIVGAGGAGLSLSLLLHQQGIPSVLIERHPVGLLASEQSLVGPAASLLTQGSDDKLLPKEKKVSLFSIIAGYRYHSQAVLSEDATPSLPDEIELQEELTGQPGSRVPHLWVERQGQRISTLDLLDGHFVLLAGPDGASWRDAAPGAAASLGVNLAAYSVGLDGDLLDLESGWLAKMGVSAEGAVLIRPDGFVAWRSYASASSLEQRLVQVLSSVLCRSTLPTRLL
jgi:putative polyketide hydroxylase